MKKIYSWEIRASNGDHIGYSSTFPTIRQCMLWMADEMRMPHSHTYHLRESTGYQTRTLFSFTAEGVTA